MTAVQRAILVMAIASTAALIVVWFAPWQLTIVVAWDAGAVWFVASVWLAVRTLDATQTQAVALREDDSRVVAHALLVTASLMSLVGVALDLVKGDQLEGFGKALLTTFGLFTVVAAWAVVHTVCAFVYAHEYYSTAAGRDRLQVRGLPARLSGLRVRRVHDRHDVPDLRHRHSTSAHPAHRATAHARCRTCSVR